MLKVPMIIIFFLNATRVIHAQNLPQDTAIVAYVNGEPVIVREFIQQAQNERSQVIRLFRIKYDCEYDNDFWNRSFDGTTPSDLLKEKTMDTMVQIKVQQILAKNYGINSNISYTEFLKALEQENLRRINAKRNGEVIYGPVQYSEAVYYNYLFSNMVIQLKYLLSEQVFMISDDVLQTEYEQVKDTLCMKGYFTEARLFELRYKASSDDAQAIRIKEKANEMMQIIRDMIIQQKGYTDSSLKDMVGKDPELSIIISDLVYNDSIYSPEEENEFQSMVNESVKKLEKGECSPVLQSSGVLCLIYISNKESLGYKSFDRCRNVLRDSLIDRLYNQYIYDLKINAKVELNNDIYRQICFN